jgi:hypothetical protein
MVVLTAGLTGELAAGLVGLVGALVGGVLSYGGTRYLARVQREALENQLDAEREARVEAVDEARRVARRERVEDDLRLLSTAIGRFEAAVEAFTAARLDRRTDSGTLPPPSETDLVAIYVARAELEASIQRLPLERSDSGGQQPSREQSGSKSSERGGGSASRRSAECEEAEPEDQSGVVTASPPSDWAEVWDQLVVLVSFWPPPPTGARFLEVIDATEREELARARTRFRSQASLAFDALRVARSFPDPGMPK